MNEKESTPPPRHPPSLTAFQEEDLAQWIGLAGFQVNVSGSLSPSCFIWQRRHTYLWWRPTWGGGPPGVEAHVWWRPMGGGGPPGVEAHVWWRPTWGGGPYVVEAHLGWRPMCGGGPPGGPVSPWASSGRT